MKWIGKWMRSHSESSGDPNLVSNKLGSRFVLLDRICAKLRRGGLELSHVSLLPSAQCLSHLITLTLQFFNSFFGSELHKFVDEGISGMRLSMPSRALSIEAVTSKQDCPSTVSCVARLTFFPSSPVGLYLSRVLSISNLPCLILFVAMRYRGARRRAGTCRELLQDCRGDGIFIRRGEGNVQADPR